MAERNIRIHVIDAVDFVKHAKNLSKSCPDCPDYLVVLIDPVYNTDGKSAKYVMKCIKSFSKKKRAIIDKRSVALPRINDTVVNNTLDALARRWVMYQPEFILFTKNKYEIPVAEEIKPVTGGDWSWE